MNKLILITILSFATSVAMAQSNSASTTINGTNNASDINQTGNLNSSQVDIGGQDQTSDIDQDGSSNFAWTRLGTLFGSGIDAIINQFGSDNYADIFNDGTDVDGTITQDGNRNRAEIIAGFSNSDINIDGTIDQDGDDNTGYMNQRGSDHVGYIQQLGTTSSATVRQSGTNNEGGVYQGRIDIIFPFSDGTSIGNTATVNQSGSDNSGGFGNTGDGALIVQGLQGGIAENSTASITQSGTFGQVGTVQGNFGTTTGSDVNVDQGGTDNYVFTRQGTGGSSTDDEIYVNQFAGVNGGVNNNALIEQGFFSTSSNSYAEVQQGGEFDEATVSQRGDNNSATVLQGTTAASSGNRARVAQAGDDNSVTATQLGVNNITLLDQQDGSSGTLLQNGTDNVILGIGSDVVGGLLFDALSIGGSTLNVTQLGTGNALFVSQTNGGIANVMQDGLTNTSIIIQN